MMNQEIVSILKPNVESDKTTHEEKENLAEMIRKYETLNLSADVKELEYKLWLQRKLDEGWLMIKNLKWSKIRSRYVCPIVSSPKDFLGRYTHVEKAIFMVSTEECKPHSIPLTIIDGAIKQISTLKNPPEHYAIWYLASQQEIKQLNKSLNTPLICPALVGYWSKQGWYGNWGISYATNQKHCAVLGLWGKDLEEINLAVLRSNE